MDIGRHRPSSTPAGPSCATPPRSPPTGRPYRRVVSAGFGLWLDYDWRKKGWDVQDPAKNYFTPAGFEAAPPRRRSSNPTNMSGSTPRRPAGGPRRGGSVALPPAYADVIRAPARDWPAIERPMMDHGLGAMRRRVDVSAEGLPGARRPTEIHRPPARDDAPGPDGPMRARMRRRGSMGRGPKSHGTIDRLEATGPDVAVRSGSRRHVFHISVESPWPLEDRDGPKSREKSPHDSVQKMVA